MVGSLAMGKKILIDVTERGRAGGKARRDNMSPEDRSTAARKAVNARWDAVRAKAAKRKPRSRRKAAV